MLKRLSLLAALVPSIALADAPLCDDPAGKILWKKDDERNTWFCAAAPHVERRVLLFVGSCPPNWEAVEVVGGIRLAMTPQTPVTACMRTHE